MPQIIFRSLAAMIALAPLPFASNRPWAWSLLALGVGALLVAWAVAELRSPQRSAIPLRWHAPASAAFLLALLWAFAQACPWLPGVAPHPLWEAAARALGTASPFAAVSLDPGASIGRAMRLLTYGATFWLALHLCRDTGRARQLLWVIVLSGTAYAIYGLIVQFSSLDSILWYRKWAYGNSLTSTFVNRNSYATYAGMVAIAALALLASEEERATPVAGAVTTRLVDALDGLRGRAYALLGCLLIVGSALLMTESRAGIASAAAGIAVFFLALALYRRRRHGHTALYAGIVLFAMLLVVMVSGQGFLHRLTLAGENLHDRATVWTMTREAIAVRPLAGTGLGTFDDVYLAQRDERLPSRTHPSVHAHNTYLENALELGIPVSILLTGAVAWLGAWCLHGVAVRRRHGVYPCAAVGALSLCGLHAGFDFSLL